MLKKIRLARQTDWQRKSSFQEMQVTNALDHPYIVPHVESWVDRGHTINIVYGYCERGDLNSLLHRYRTKKQTVPESNLKLWLCQCLMALEHCHHRQVLHRDIKSGNIFLTSEGNVAVGDFGLATVRDGGDGDDHSLVGTPHYMSPELLAKRPYSFPADVFSLGVVMYELTAQRPPFTAFNIHGLINKIKRSPMPALPSGYSAEWCNVVRNMLRKQPDQRPSAADLLNCAELRDAYQEARRRAAALMPEYVLPKVRAEPFELQRPAATPSRQGSGRLGDRGGGATPKGRPDSGAEEEPGRPEDRRQAIPSAASIRQRSRAPVRASLRVDREMGDLLSGPGAIGDEFDGSVAQVVPRGGDEYDYGTHDSEGARDEDDGDGWDEDPRGPGPRSAPRLQIGTPAGAAPARRGNRAIGGEGRRSPRKHSPRKHSPTHPATGRRPILSSWSPRNADAARRAREQDLPLAGLAGAGGEGGGEGAGGAPRTPAPAGLPRHPGAPAGDGTPQISSFPVSPMDATPGPAGLARGALTPEYVSPGDSHLLGGATPHTGPRGQARTESTDAGGDPADPDGGVDSKHRDALRTKEQSAADLAEVAYRSDEARSDRESDYGEEGDGGPVPGHPAPGPRRPHRAPEAPPRRRAPTPPPPARDPPAGDGGSYYTDGEEGSLEAELEDTRAELDSARQALELAARLYDAGRLEELGYLLHQTSGVRDPPGVDAGAPGSRLQLLQQARKGCPFQLGDQVIVGNRRRMRAVIRYYGPTAFGDGSYVGMELEQPDGKNDGSVGGVPYFACRPGCGLFVQSHILRPEDPAGSPAGGGQ